MAGSEWRLELCIKSARGGSERSRERTLPGEVLRERCERRLPKPVARTSLVFAFARLAAIGPEKA